MIPNPHKKSFIVFEGIDFSGKSSQFDMMKKHLDAMHLFKRIHTKEPDAARTTGNQIYSILNGKNSEYNLDKMAPFHFQTFYIEDRMINYRTNIIPALQNGLHVLQDRGVASTLCYGSESSKDFYDFMGIHNRIFSAAQVPFFWPDLTLIYDVPAEISAERMKSSSRQLDAFENIKKLRLVRQNYLDFAKMYPNVFIIDGQPEEKKVFEETLNYIMPLLIKSAEL